MITPNLMSPARPILSVIALLLISRFASPEALCCRMLCRLISAVRFTDSGFVTSRDPADESVGYDRGPHAGSPRGVVVATGLLSN